MSVFPPSPLPLPPLPQSGALALGGDVAILAWNAAATGRDGVPAGVTTGVTARNNGAAPNEAPRAHGEAGCGPDDRRNGMGWCWRHCGLQSRGGGTGCSVKGMVDKVAACYDEAAGEEALCLSLQTKPPVPGPLGQIQTV